MCPKDAGHSAATLQRVVVLPANLCGADGGSCHFPVHFNVPHQRLCVVQTPGRVTFTVRYQALCGAGVLLCLFLLLDVVYLPILCKTSVGRRYDKTNGKW